MKKILSTLFIVSSLCTVIAFAVLEIPQIVHILFLNAKINILLLDATSYSDRGPLEIVRRELKREYPNWVIDADFEWKDKVVRETSLLFWQRKRNRKYARALDYRIPKKIEVRSYDDDPGGYHGFDEKRDLILFVGKDYREILRGLR